MNAASTIVVIAIVAGLILAVRHILKGGGSCGCGGGCSGHCGGCSGSCCSGVPVPKKGKKV